MVHVRACSYRGDGKPDFASVNLSEPGADELAGLLRELGIAVEAGVWSVADADQLAESDSAPECCGS